MVSTFFCSYYFEIGIELETLILCTGDKLSSQIKNFNCTIFTHLTADTCLVLGQKLVKKQMFKVHTYIGRYSA